MRFRSILIASAFGLATAIGSASVLAAGHDEPGTPGEPNCHGQTVAWLNQLGKEADPPVNGLGNMVGEDAFFPTVADLQDAVRVFCEPEDDDDDGDES
jgi:hypothetical protein